ncbi:MAG: hypothetical protein ACU0CO_02180 [Shimia sp.]
MLTSNVTQAVGELVWDGGQRQQVAFDLATRRDEPADRQRAWLPEEKLVRKGKTPVFRPAKGSPPLLVSRHRAGGGDTWALKLARQDI